MSMPQSRARKAICSAPLECPSRPGLPTRNLSRRPSGARPRPPRRGCRRDLRSCSRRPWTTPVGPRYSPWTARICSGPFAGRDARLRRGNRGGHDVAALARRSAQVRPARPPRRLHRRGLAPVVQPADLLGLDRGIDGHDAAVLAHQRRRLAFGPALTPTTIGLAALDPADRRHCFDQPRLHVVDRPDRAAHRVEVGQFGPRACPSAPRPCARPPDCRRRGRRIPAGPSHRPGSAACASTIADPTGAAGPAPRSRRAVARRGRAPFSTASRPASRSGCGRRCFPAAARSGPG